MVFWVRLRQRASDYIANRTPYFILSIVILVMGIVFGALSVKALYPGQKAELWQYVRTFFENVGGQNTVGSGVLLRQSVLSHLRTMALVTIMGLSVIGSPLILLFLFTRGFVIGFSVGFLVEQLLLKGVLLSIGAVLPQNLLIVPALVFASVACLDFSVALVRGRAADRMRGVGIFRELGMTASVVLLSCIVLLLASVVEAYICPVFLDVLGGLLV